MTSDLGLKTIKPYPIQRAAHTRLVQKRKCPERAPYLIATVFICSFTNMRDFQIDHFLNEDMILPVVIQFKQLQIKPKFQDFNWIRTYVSAAVLYQLSYEDAYIMRRPIC